MENTQAFPCGKNATDLGINVGDRLVVVEADIFEKGDIVTLYYDDNSACPQFRSTTTGEICWEVLSSLGPIQEPQQTTEELVAENASLAEQIDKLTARRLAALAEAEELAERISRKQKFYLQNADEIKKNIPEEVRKYAPYL